MLMEQIIGADGTIRTKLDIDIQRLKSFEPPEGYFLAFSGGKDSQCIYHLAKMAGVKFEAHYHVTSVDPPELIYFIREHYPDVIFDIPHDKDGKPKTTQKKADELGVEYEVSKSGTLVMNEDNDENRRLAEFCYRTQKMLLNPIVDWTDDEVWEFLNDIVKVPHCRLYDEGYKRIGCIGCPMAGAAGQKAEFKRYPKFRALYVRAFERMIEQRKSEGLPTTWMNGEDVMRWWIQEGQEETAND